MESNEAKVSAAEKTLLVLEAVLSKPRFTDVVASTGLAKATTHRILTTLSARGFVTMTDDGSYLPGPTILALAGLAVRSTDIINIAEPHVRKLVEKVNCTVHVGALNGNRVIYVLKTEAPSKPYQMPSRVGHEIPLHSSGIGKSILSGFDTEDLQKYFENPGLSSRTVHTITKPAVLIKELGKIRERGYALDNEENVPGVVCVAAPIHDHMGRIRYGISISTIVLEHELAELETMSDEVIECAAQISAALGYLPPLSPNR